MTPAEAAAQSFDRPLIFVKGNGGIEGFYGKVYYKGEMNKVYQHGQWAFPTREAALKASRRYARIWQEVEAR